MSQLFGLPAELHAPQYSDQQLQVLDIDGARVSCRVSLHHLVLDGKDAFMIDWP